MSTTIHNLTDKTVAYDLMVRPLVEERDAEIVKSARAALRTNACVPVERINVAVANGLVTLEGSVQWEVQKMLAEALVRRLSGITGIRNRIEVRPQDFLPETENGAGENGVASLYQDVSMGGE
jgi:uncharacterized protein YjaG (DUF416 family)